ncbi:hypothetical protein [Winogradskyella ursingii]|uniref:hypothetical protein n=1 Tax=Winogradskyella ursingii TaxID=2686079 RepID=UPI0015C8C96B|nr:hypothetical protein [Winogradskyella ursingii]
MKIRILILNLVLLAFMSCEKTEDVVFDPTTGQTGLSFTSPTLSVTVPEEGVTLNFEVTSTTISDTDRTFNVMADTDPEATTANPSDYSLGVVTIPAGSHIGSLPVTLNFDSLDEGVNYTLKIDLSLPDDVVGVRNSSININFTPEFVCPDLVLNFTFDDYPGETSWEVTNSSGSVVASAEQGDYSGQTAASIDLCLLNGTYTLTVFDSFGDGICCAYGNGSYEVVLDGMVLISGGEFGGSESQNFTVN